MPESISLQNEETSDVKFSRTWIFTRSAKLDEFELHFVLSQSIHTNPFLLLSKSTACQNDSKQTLKSVSFLILSSAKCSNTNTSTRTRVILITTHGIFNFQHNYIVAQYSKHRYPTLKNISSLSRIFHQLELVSCHLPQPVNLRVHRM